MGAINVRVSDISGSRVNEVEAPDDVPVNRILVVLIERMNLPLNSPDGQLMSYKLHHRRTGQQLLDNQTLGQAGVTAGDELRLQPEITAGSGKFGRDGALRRPRPRPADGTEFSTALTYSIAPLNAARTAQRAVPT
ncbi:MAG TPA: EsaB/YukD family protein [Candidatus Polarisedimenticolia bacterium]|nr:EsaB/YukD family protein [Candidatus Polarisedimenticolia bacterium]